MTVYGLMAEWDIKTYLHTLVILLMQRLPSSVGCCHQITFLRRCTDVEGRFSLK